MWGIYTDNTQSSCWLTAVHVVTVNLGPDQSGMEVLFLMIHMLGLAMIILPDALPDETFPIYLGLGPALRVHWLVASLWLG